MRTFRSHIIQYTAAVILAVALLIPSVTNILHSAQGHDHFDNCENPSDIHVHKKEINCNLYDVTLKKNGIFNLIKPVVFKRWQAIAKKATYPQVIYTSVYLTADSRGPPHC